VTGGRSETRTGPFSSDAVLMVLMVSSSQKLHPYFRHSVPKYPVERT
jgi:hypothetical protein